MNDVRNRILLEKIVNQWTLGRSISVDVDNIKILHVILEGRYQRGSDENLSACCVKAQIPEIVGVYAINISM
jgi:hypothetical protein